MQTTEKIVTILKMLGLYLYTLRNSHKSCNMLSILNEFTLQKELQTFVTNNLFWTKVKSQKQQNKTKKNPLPELNRGALTSKADALPLHHRVKWASLGQQCFSRVDKNAPSTRSLFILLYRTNN